METVEECCFYDITCVLTCVYKWCVRSIRILSVRLWWA